MGTFIPLCLLRGVVTVSYGPTFIPRNPYTLYCMEHTAVLGTLAMEIHAK
jgi:hypothetical protein